MPSVTLHMDGKLLATHEVHLDAWPQDGQEAHLIFICKDRYKELELSGLVLERVQERRGCYRRLGRFMTTAEGREDGMKWVRPGGRPSDNVITNMKRFFQVGTLELRLFDRLFR